MQHAKTRAEAVEAEARPCGKVVTKALVIHDFESAWEEGTTLACIL